MDPILARRWSHLQFSKTNLGIAWSAASWAYKVTTQRLKIISDSWIENSWIFSSTFSLKRSQFALLKLYLALELLVLLWYGPSNFTLHKTGAWLLSIIWSVKTSKLITLHATEVELRIRFNISEWLDLYWKYVGVESLLITTKSNSLSIRSKEFTFRSPNNRSSEPNYKYSFTASKLRVLAGSK